MNHIYSVDVGFGRVKAVRTGKRVEFASLSGQFHPIRFDTGVERALSSETLCVEYCGRRYYVGEIARRQSIPQATMGKERFLTDEGMVLMLTALALISVSNKEELKIVTGLPVSYFSALKEPYRNRLIGKHSITLLQSDGEWGTDYSVTITDVTVIPQPVGTLFWAILSEDGRLTKSECAAGSLAVLDIGHHTVDLARLDSLEFIDRESTSYNDIGMFQVYQELSNTLGQKYQIHVCPEDMETIARAGHIKIGGKQKDIQDEISSAYQSATERIVTRAKNTWKSLWTIDRIYITGGGSFALADHLLKEFGQAAQVEICPDATFTNCMGYLRYGNRCHHEK